jgi:hypothetical protein
MSILTAKDIAKYFNDIVAFYMSKGYAISPFTESGYPHVDLVKPNDLNHVLRVWMATKTEKVGTHWWQSVENVTIVVKKYEKGINFTSPYYENDYLSINEGSIVGNEKHFYMFKESYSKHKNSKRKTYSDDLNEATRLVNLANNRKSNAYDLQSCYDNSRAVATNKLPSNFVDSIMERINNKHGFKRATASCITEVVIYKDLYSKKLQAAVRFKYKDKSESIILR